MNKYLYSWFFILSTVHSSLLIAESMVVSDSLTRQQVIAFKSTTLKISLLNAEYPELAEYSQQFDFNKSKQVIAFLKKSNAYSKIEIILQDTEIEDLNQVFKISQKVMGGLYFLNRNKDDTNQSVSQFETIRNVLLDNLARFKKQSDSSIGNNSEFLIKETEVQLALLDKQLIIVKQSLESLTDADKLFLEENSEWFKKQF